MNMHFYFTLCKQHTTRETDTRVGKYTRARVKPPPRRARSPSGHYIFTKVTHSRRSHSGNHTSSATLFFRGLLHSVSSVRLTHSAFFTCTFWEEPVSRALIMRFIAFILLLLYGSSLFSSGSLSLYWLSHFTLTFMLVVCGFLFSSLFSSSSLHTFYRLLLHKLTEPWNKEISRKPKDKKCVLPSFFTNCSSSSICEKSPANEGEKEGRKCRQSRRRWVVIGWKISSSWSGFSFDYYFCLFFFSTHLVYCPRPCLSGRHCGRWVGKENSIRMDDFSDFLFASRKGWEFSADSPIKSWLFFCLTECPARRFSQTSIVVF